MGCFMIKILLCGNSPHTCDILSNKDIISQMRGIVQKLRRFTRIFFDFLNDQICYEFVKLFPISRKMLCDFDAVLAQDEILLPGLRG